MSSPQSEPRSEDEVKALKQTAKIAHERGDFAEAIQHQLKVVNYYGKLGTPNADESKLLCLYLYGLRDYTAAAQLLGHLQQTFPDDPENYENLGVIYRKLNRIPEAIEQLEKAAAMDPEKSNVHDALAHSYGKTGEIEKCREHGRLSLEIKNRESLAAGIRHPVPDDPPPPFSYQNNNVISFSLWGDNPRYLNGAIRNARLIPDIYPGWRCRVYHDDSVPGKTITELRKLEAELISVAPPKNFYDGLFWRFLPASDKSVDRFLVRDIDSVVNVKERIAVDHWLESECYFHLMRDYYSHSELILAGMWGGVGGILPPLKQLLREFKPTLKATETFDQFFLRLTVWPTVSQSLLSHDSTFGALGAVPFPPYGNLPPNRHIGQNEAAIRKEE